MSQSVCSSPRSVLPAVSSPASSESGGSPSRLRRKRSVGGAHSVTFPLVIGQTPNSPGDKWDIARRVPLPKLVSNTTTKRSLLLLPEPAHHSCSSQAPQNAADGAHTPPLEDGAVSTDADAADAECCEDQSNPAMAVAVASHTSSRSGLHAHDARAALDLVLELKEEMVSKKARPKRRGKGPTRAAAAALEPTSHLPDAKLMELTSDYNKLAWERKQKEERLEVLQRELGALATDNKQQQQQQRVV
mmetsp:Transcript_18686/g.60989  ORF Transcript_18686/g.60989 Transcript_18686/m.60989 type:complete len:246 (-) Transcript_18686:133-870(-)